MTQLFFENALLADGWNENVRIKIDDVGWITEIVLNGSDTDVDFRGGTAVPGMTNVHSHAFQRAMAGFAERKGNPNDSFWTWRQEMYRFLKKLSPDDISVIAGLLYTEMLEAGFTSVVEFHYLHHDPEGQEYSDIGAMCEAVVKAAVDSGIGLTLLPVFYRCGGFGGKAPSEGQSRFINTTDRYSVILDRAIKFIANVPDGRVGIAPHSLRALTQSDLENIVAMAPDGPIHIHISEQMKEVEDCVAWSGRRPVEWLLEHVDVDDRWCLVHATHMTDGERSSVADSGAVAGICPITEANLGDGIFDGISYLNDGGSFGIGSDSNIFVSVAEELRLFEYTQRLRDRNRNCICPQDASTGHTLFTRAAKGGAKASGRKTGALAEGFRGDIVMLDVDHPALIARSGDQWLDGWIFAGDNQVVSDVWVGGRHVVRGGTHASRGQMRGEYAKTLGQLINT